MSEEKMIKLGTVDENTPRGNAYDASDLSAEKAVVEETEKDKQED